MLSLQEPYNQFSENDEKALEKICSLLEIDKIRICEIGSWLGHSTSILAKHAKRLNGKVICIDTFLGSKGTFLEDYSKENDVYTKFMSNMFQLGLDKNINVLFMEASTAHKFIDDEYFDLIFIDGDHIYKQVSDDIKNYLPKVKKEGIISGHDFEIGFDLDLKSLSELDLSQDMSRGFHCGVVKAVRENFKNINQLYELKFNTIMP